MTDSVHPYLLALDSLTEASETGDARAFAELFTEDAIIWQSHRDRDLSVRRFMKIFPVMEAWVTNRRYEDRRTDLFDHGAVTQHVLRGRRIDDGSPVQLHCCVVVRFDDDGKIVSLNEYLDSSEAAAFGPPQRDKGR